MQQKELKQHSPVKNEFAASNGEPVAVRFAKGDPEDPAEGWRKMQRYTALALAMFVTYTSAFNATANGAASGGFREDHPGTTSVVFQTSSFTYLAMLGIGPLILAPVSETFGRRPQIVICTAIITILFIGMALAPNIACLSILRLIQGTAASVEGPVAAGVVADLWPKRVRGPAMGLFVLTVFTANATGPLCANWIAFKLNWHWVYWIQMMSNGLCFLLCLAFFKEPRAEVILSKRAARLQKETGVPHYVAGSDHYESWGQKLKSSCSRPILYLTTEPIVTALSLWTGLAWGSVFLFVGQIPGIFKTTYGFNTGEAGTVLICGFIGAALSYFIHLTVQERIFYKNALAKGHGKASPEVRLYSSSVGALFFAVGLFCFAWTARPWIHWIVPCIFVVMFNMGIYQIYLSVYLYLGDAYDTYSSSAQASQSLLRNILGGVFPFFAPALYKNLGYPWASTLLGFIALAFAVVPWTLIFFGERLRAKSRVARQMEQQEGDVLVDEPRMTEVEMP
ncbi:hypothetical protein JCM8097_007461 [Rhodosporidiobolus ruineniae]